MKSTHSRLALACLLPLLAACPAEPPASDGAVEAEPEAPTDHVDVPPQVQRNLGLRFAAVEVRELARTVRVPGAFELLPRARREYRMSLPGRIELLVDQYEEVRAGQLLYRYQSPAWPELQHEIVTGEQQIATGESQLALANARLEEGRAKLALHHERIELLAQANVRRAELELEAAELEAELPRLAAEQELARTTLANARRTREHALHRAATAAQTSEQELEREIEHAGVRLPAYRALDWIEVHADADGIVERLEVTDGAFAESPDTVLTTVDLRQLRFRALALQADLQEFVEQDVARIVPPRAPGQGYAAGVGARLGLGLEAHPEERTLTLLAEPDELASWMRPGVSAFLEVVVESTGTPALVIPSAAVVRDGLSHVFFRRSPSDPHRALRVEADLGQDDGRWVVVNSGLTRNDQVVVEGAYELNMALGRRGSAPSGTHVHADGTTHSNH